jgi:hypothetical protein
LWLPEAGVVVVADNFPLDKTIRVLLVMQEPHKAETDKAEAVVTELVEAEVEAAKMVVLVADYLVVTTVVILEKMVTVWHRVAALYRLAVTGEYPMVQAAQAALLSAIILKSFRLGI